MSSGTRAAAIGAAIKLQPTTPEGSLEEVLYAVVQEALSDAALKIESIDGIVVAGNDQIDGRAISVMAASGSVGGVDRDILSTPSASEHAFVMGTLRVQSGLYDTQLIVAWNSLEAQSIPEVERLGADPYYHRALPLDELSAHALQATALEAKVSNLRAVATAVAAKNRKRGTPSLEPLRPSRWPLSSEMVAPRHFSAVAIVLASDRFISAQKVARPVAWVEGMGWATEPSFLGDRDLALAPALTAATQRAYSQADIANPLRQIDFAEVADLTPYQELLAYEGLGLAARGKWAELTQAGAFAEGGLIPVNLSGGAQCSNAGFCIGLRSIAEVVTRIRSQKQGAKTYRRGLAQAASGPAMQYQTAVVLGAGA